MASALSELHCVYAKCKVYRTSSRAAFVEWNEFPDAPLVRVHLSQNSTRVRGLWCNFARRHRAGRCLQRRNNLRIGSGNHFASRKTIYLHTSSVRRFFAQRLRPERNFVDGDRFRRPRRIHTVVILTRFNPRRSWRARPKNHLGIIPVTLDGNEISTGHPQGGRRGSALLMEFRPIFAEPFDSFQLQSFKPDKYVANGTTWKKRMAFSRVSTQRNFISFASERPLFSVGRRTGMHADDMHSCLSFGPSSSLHAQSR